MKTVASGIDQRVQESKAYQLQLEEEYKRGIQQYNNRKAVVDNGIMLAGKARAAGATIPQKKAAIASGKTGLAEFTKALAKAQAKKGDTGAPLLASEIDVMIEGEGTFTEEDNVQEILERTYGIFIDDEEANKIEDKRSGFQRAFAADPLGAAKARIAATPSGTGLSKLDIIDLARQDSYRSLATDKGSVFLTLERAATLDPIDIEDFLSLLNDIEDQVEDQFAKKPVGSYDDADVEAEINRRKSNLLAAQLERDPTYLTGVGFDGPQDLGIIMPAIKTQQDQGKTSEVLNQLIAAKVGTDIGNQTTETKNARTLSYSTDVNGNVIGPIKAIDAEGKVSIIQRGDTLEEQLAYSQFIMRFRKEGFDLPGVITMEAMTEEDIAATAPLSVDKVKALAEKALAEEASVDKKSGDDALRSMQAAMSKPKTVEQVSEEVKALAKEHEEADEIEKEKLVPKIRETVQSAQSVGLFESDEFKYLKGLVTGFFTKQREDLSEVRKKVAESKAPKVSETEEIEVYDTARFGGQTFTITDDGRVFVNNRRTGKPKTEVTQAEIKGPLLEQIKERTDSHLNFFFREYAVDKGFANDKQKLLQEWNDYAEKNALSPLFKNKVIASINNMFRGN